MTWKVESQRSHCVKKKKEKEVNRPIDIAFDWFISRRYCLYLRISQRKETWQQHTYTSTCVFLKPRRRRDTNSNLNATLNNLSHFSVVKGYGAIPFLTWCHSLDARTYTQKVWKIRIASKLCAAVCHGSRISISLPWYGQPTRVALSWGFICRSVCQTVPWAMLEEILRLCQSWASRCLLWTHVYRTKSRIQRCLQYTQYISMWISMWTQTQIK